MRKLPRTVCVAVTLLVICYPVHVVLGQFVATKQHVALKKDTRGELPCEMDGEIYGVFWNKGETYETSENVVFLDLHHSIGQRSGPGYTDGSFNISDDFSLIVYKVDIQNEGRFFCAIPDRESSKLFWNSTDVSVYAVPEDRSLTIDKCSMNSTLLEDGSPCTIYTSLALNITCTVDSYYPNITLDFYHNSLRIDTVDNQEWINTDGTKGRNISIEAAHSNEPYICQATNLPGSGGQDVLSTEIVVLFEEGTTQAEMNTVSKKWSVDESSRVAIIVPCVVGSVLVIAVAAVVLTSRKRLISKKMERNRSASSLFEEDTELQSLLPEWTKETDDWTLPDERQGEISCMVRLDDRRIAIGYENYGIDILTIETKSVFNILPGGKIRAMGLLPSGDLVICEGDMREIKIVNIEDKTVSKNIYHRTSAKSAISLCVSSTGSILRGNITEHEISEFDERGEELRVVKDLEVEPRQIFALPNGEVGIANGHFGGTYAVRLLKADESRISVVEQSRKLCPFATCDEEGNLYVAFVSQAGKMSVEKFTGDGKMVELVVSGHKINIKHFGIEWWITMVAMSPERLVVADEERICFYQKPTHC